jgi:hypothetical protein
MTNALQQTALTENKLKHKRKYSLQITHGQLIAFIHIGGGEMWKHVMC